MTTSTYYSQHKEEIAFKSKARYLANKEEILARQKKYRDNDPERTKGYRKKWLKEFPLYDTYHNAKRRAKDFNIPFDIHYKDKELIAPEVCPILGIKLDKTLGFEYSPSLDRVDPKKGYVKGNIAIISMKANRMKGDATAEEHRKIADYIDSFKKN